MPDGLSLSDPVSVLPGVGPKRAERLRVLGIESIEDLLRHVPRAYEDRGAPLPAAEVALRPGGFVVVRGTVRSARLVRRRGRPPTLRARLEDASGGVDALWFHAAFLASEVTAGRTMAWAGRVSNDGVLLQPELAPVAEEEDVPARLVGIRPAYPLTEGITQRFLWTLVEESLTAVGEVEDPLPAEARRLADVETLDRAIRGAHRPASMEEAERARERLLLDELLPVELAVRRRSRARREREAPRGDGRGGGADALARALPFTLTPSQRDAVEDAVADLAGPCPMARMVVGEVGCGKTVVALAAIEEARSRGLQCAFLAPTDLLARQHHRTACELLPGGGGGVVLLTGSLAPGEARAARERLAAGDATFAIGTHALLSEATSFAKLGLVVIDEQHRFGVAQRAALLEKAETPHCLVLTATPIPRSLALLAFGDTELSVLESRPDAARDVTTRVVPRRKRRAALQWVAERIAGGEQAFFVRPRIEGEEGAKELHEELLRGVLRGRDAALIHGRLGAAERDERLDAFRRGDVPALVATTLIEVGLDVPGASILWVEGAERLGLAQIHQLRGRIARRGQKGYCWLVEGADAPEESVERLGVLAEVDDGFRLAEIDLATRGPGELLGWKQSGRLGPFAAWGTRAADKLASVAERAARVAELLLEEAK